MDVWYVLPLTFSVAVVAIAGGVGGGLFFVPFFTLVMGLGIQTAIGTALVAQTAGSAGGTYGHWRNRTIDWKFAGQLIVGGSPGVVAGFFLGQVIPAMGLRILFAVVLLLVSWMLFTQAPEGDLGHGEEEVGTKKRRELTDSRGRFYRYPVGRWLRVMAAGGVSGVGVGMVAIGGGELNTPYMRRIVGVPLRICISTSVATMMGTSLVAALLRMPAAQVIWPIALVGALGTLLGSQVGARAAAIVPPDLMRKILVGLFVVMAGLMLVQAFAAK